MKVVCNAFTVITLAIIAMGNCNDESKNAEHLTASLLPFIAKTFSEVAKNNVGRSFVLSALSVVTPLAQLAVGSEGSSRDELLRAIGLLDDDSIKSVYADLNKKMTTVKGVELYIASKIYVSNLYHLNDDFEFVLKKIFLSSIQSVDFSKTQKTSGEINAWVEDHTNHRIKDIVDPNTLTQETSVLLVNAMYFKGTWLYMFDKKLTSDRDFHVSREKTVKVPTMFRKGNFNYGESEQLNAKILGIPYEGGVSEFYIILPNSVDGINELENKLKNSSILDKALNNTFDTEVEAYIPKFIIETTTNLRNILPKIGVSKIFDATQANLTKVIKEPGDLYVSEAIQKAFIEINEEGAEGAAANAFIIGFTAPLLPPPTFKFVADHPFVFVLEAGGFILFSGVYSP